MIDLHCHILPGIDDGPATLTDALELARTAVAAGTTTIVATPHISWDYPAITAAAIAEGVADLQAVLVREGIPLELRTGGEISITRAMELTDEELVALRLGGAEGTHLLVECPLSATATGFDRLVGVLRAKGHEILLGHPERCPAFQRDPAVYERLVADGMLGQVTAGALVGRFGRTVQQYGDHLVRSGLAQDVASDAHNATRRPPSIRAELEQAGFGRQAAWLGHDVPHAVLTGARLPLGPPMPKPPARGLKRLLRRAT